VVALSPDHKAVTMGGPAERRAFIDGLMAQSSKRVTELLYEHRRLLKQRNAMLAEAAHHGRASAGLDAWTDAFITCSADLVRRRYEAITELTPRVRETYDVVSGGEESIDLRYDADGVEDLTGDVADQLRRSYEAVATRELHRGVTLFGPQKDDVTFTIDDGVVRETASQGQHKSLLVSLKIAECTLLWERRQERPVVLLDDVFSELDRSRCEHVMQTVLAMGMQCFVTTTEGDEMRRLVPASADVAVREITKGDR
jgi:DNA replication and repair protein RecF